MLTVSEQGRPVHRRLPWRLRGLLVPVALLGACAASQPRDITNVCAIFEDRRDWYRAAKAAEERWQVPISVNMAFIYQESGFQARARPARSRILWLIPGPRPSSAYGYAQALDTTWREYEERSGNYRASRASFEDAIDFVAWYNAVSTRLSRLSPEDARSLYLAYHEGNGGFQRGSHREKRWLLDAASRVQANANSFRAQLDGCRSELEKKWWQRLFS